MSLQLLEDNWNNIREKVIIPLWKGKFKSVYVESKLDYDDFESLAGEELSKGFLTYDESKSNIYTFATNIITRKAKTELRNANRQKRRAEFGEISLYELLYEDSGVTIEDIIEQQEDKESDDEIRLGAAIQAVKKVLNAKEYKVFKMLLTGFDPQTISATLNLDAKIIANTRKKLIESSCIRIFRMHGFLGGNNDEV